MTKKEKLKISPIAFVGMQNRNGKLPLRIVWEEVCEYFDIDAQTLRSKSRKREIITPRHTYYYLARLHTNSTYAYIGEYGSDGSWNAGHSNVKLMGDKVGLMLQTDSDYRTAVEKVNAILISKKYG